jgi:WD40 repeat protein
VLKEGSRDYSVRMWDAQTGEPLWSPRGHSKDNPECRCQFDDSGELEGHCDECPAKTWHRDVVASVAFSPNGSIIASGSWDRTVGLWDAMTGANLGSPAASHRYI